MALVISKRRAKLSAPQKYPGRSTTVRKRGPFADLRKKAAAHSQPTRNRLRHETRLRPWSKQAMQIRQLDGRPHRTYLSAAALVAKYSSVCLAGYPTDSSSGALRVPITRDPSARLPQITSAMDVYTSVGTSAATHASMTFSVPFTLISDIRGSGIGVKSTTDAMWKTTSIIEHAASSFILPKSVVMSPTWLDTRSPCAPS
eukprot:scaffold19011_cov32-Tisochrysis_lutea.AAC.2